MQRSATVSRIDRGIGLDEALDPVLVLDDVDVPPDGRNDARGDRGGQSKRIPDRHDPFTHLHILGVAKGGRQEVLRVDLDDRKIGRRVSADQLCLVLHLLVEDHLDPVLRRICHHVVVRDDIAIGRDHNTGTIPLLGLGLAPDPAGLKK